MCFYSCAHTLCLCVCRARSTICFLYIRVDCTHCGYNFDISVCNLLQTRVVSLRVCTHKLNQVSPNVRPKRLKIFCGRAMEQAFSANENILCGSRFFLISPACVSVLFAVAVRIKNVGFHVFFRHSAQIDPRVSKCVCLCVWLHVCIMHQTSPFIRHFIIPVYQYMHAHEKIPCDKPSLGTPPSTPIHTYIAYVLSFRAIFNHRHTGNLYIYAHARVW